MLIAEYEICSDLDNNCRKGCRYNYVKAPRLNEEADTASS